MADEKPTAQTGILVPVDEADTDTNTPALPSYADATQNAATPTPRDGPRTTHPLDNARDVLQSIRRAIHELHDTAVHATMGPPAYITMRTARGEARTAAKNFVAVLSEFASVMSGIVKHVDSRRNEGGDRAERGPEGYGEAAEILADSLVEANTTWFQYLHPDSPRSAQKRPTNGLGALMAIHNNTATIKALSRLREPAFLDKYPALQGLSDRVAVREPFQWCLAQMSANETPALANYKVRLLWIQHMRTTFLFYVRACTKMGPPLGGMRPVSKIYLDNANVDVQDLNNRTTFNCAKYI